MTGSTDYTTRKPLSFESLLYSENMNWLEYQYYIKDIPIAEHKCTSRTLYVGNLTRFITKDELRAIFIKYGLIKSISIKNPIKVIDYPYAFIEYNHLEFAYQAKRQLSSLHFGGQKCTIGYARTVPTSTLWIGGLGPWISATLLYNKFKLFGAIKEIEYVEGKHSAYITYESVDSAKKALMKMRGDSFGKRNHYLRIDFAVCPSNIFANTKSTSHPCFHGSRRITYLMHKCESNLVPVNYHDIFDPIKIQTKILNEDHVILEKYKKRQTKRQLSPVIDLNLLGK